MSRLHVGFGRPSVSGLFVCGLLVIVACGDDEASTTSSGTGGGATSASSTDASTGATSTTTTTTTSSAGGGGGASATSVTVGTGGAGEGGAAAGCLADHAAGDRYPVGDDCNFCDCNADGSTTCTTRACGTTPGGCTYDGVDHAYAERFPSADGCNECVCAASGLACTRRPECTGDEGAILVESLDEPCGPDASFTAAAVLDGLPFDDFVAPFAYDTDGPLYPETLPDTNVRVRIVYDGGFAVCRIPNPGQEAFDIEVLAEWVTEDGAFDEGFHTYLRRDAGGFVDGWYLAMSAPTDGLDGTYDPACFDDNGFTFQATLYGDQTAEGGVGKLCETDILLTVGSFALAAP